MSHHVVESDRDTDLLLREVREHLSTRFDIDHTTIQIEVVGPEGEAEAACGEVCETTPTGAIPSPG